MSEAAASIETIVAKSKRGMISLSARSVIIYGLQTVSVVLLARWLEPRDYGIFAVLNGWIGVAYYFTDVGLMGSLIHQDAEPSERQLQTMVATQMFLCLIFCLAFWFLAPAICSYSHLGVQNVWMVRLLALSVPFYIIRSAPKLQFDRHLNFSSQARIDVLETATLYVTQIGFAYLRYGAWSFIFGIFSRAILGTTVFYSYYKKFHLPVFHIKEFKKMIKYGFAFQANAALPALRGLIFPVVMGGLLPVERVGMVTWSLSLASIPLFLALNYNQVIFPSLSRLQKNYSEFKRVASRSTELAFLIFGFLFSAAACCGVAIIATFFNAKWAPAYALFPIAALSAGLSTFRYLLAAIFNATGKPHTRLKIEIVFVLIEYALVSSLTFYFKELGYMWASVLVNVVAFGVTIYSVRHIIRLGSFVRFFVVSSAGLLSFLIISLVGVQKILYLSVPLFFVCFFSFSILIDRKITQDISAFLKLSFKRHQ